MTGLISNCFLLSQLMTDITKCSDWSLEWGPLVTKYSVGLKKTEGVTHRWVKDLLKKSREEEEPTDQQGIQHSILKQTSQLPWSIFEKKITPLVTERHTELGLNSVYHGAFDSLGTPIPDIHHL